MTPRHHSNESPKRSFLKRFAILHLSLHRLVTGNGPDEGASVEELAESTLYYYCHGNNNNNDGNDDANKEDRTSPAAIRLGGLATAFWSLPETVQRTTSSSSSSSQVEHNSSSNNDNHRYQFVTLSHCTLLLTRLDRDILAVAQLTGRDAHVTAPAMATELQRQYRLVSLFGGGRIHHRLQKQQPQTTTTTTRTKMGTDEIYPGMKQLFELHRTKRKLVEKRDTNNASAETQDTITEIQTQVEQVRSKLPITALRDDLQEHFHLFCSEWERLRNVNPACARSIVHQTPTPLPGTMSTRLLRGHNDDTANAPVDWKEIIEKFWEKSKDNTLLGVSVFAQGQFRQNVVRSSSRDNPQAKEFCLRVETSCLAMYYLSSMRHNLPVTAHEPAAAGFLRRTLGGFLQGEQRDDCDPHGTFLKPPPFSLLSATVQEISSCSVGEELVWTPLMTWDEEDDDVERRSVRVCLYNRGDYAFVLYLDPSEESAYPSVLESFVVYLSENVAFKPVAIVQTWDRPGQDILWLDRRRQSTILYSSRKDISKRDGAVLAHPDERYQLASLLSLDTLLALDDAMQHAIRESPGRYDTCTLLRHSWLVCRASNGRELYVVLDSKQYVTIQDVTVAMEHIEKHFVRNEPTQRERTNRS